MKDHTSVWGSSWDGKTLTPPKESIVWYEETKYWHGVPLAARCDSVYMEWREYWNRRGYTIDTDGCVVMACDM